MESKNKENKIKVVLEGFGGRHLKKSFAATRVRGKNVSDVVKMMLDEEWSGRDKDVQSSLSRKIAASSGSYRPQIARGGSEFGTPVEFLPSSPIDKVDPYIQKTPDQESKVRITITPAHRVGYDS